MVEVGQTAPDFVAPAVRDGQPEMFELFSELAGQRAVVLVFQPASFVPTGTAEFRALATAGWHERPDLLVAGLTGDSLYSQFAYADRYGFSFALVSDFHAGIADSYGLALEEWESHRTIPARATVVLDGDWTVQAVETDDPLTEPETGPLERAGDTLAGMGLDVECPQVNYDL